VFDIAHEQPERGQRSVMADALDSVLSSGATFRHSSGRLVLLDVSGPQEARLTQDLPGARVVSLDTDVSALIPDLDTGELLFLEAVRIRNSAEYQEKKARQTPGDSPEERLMFTAPCIPGGEFHG